MEAEAGDQPFMSFSISEYLIGFLFLNPVLNWIARLRKQSLPLLHSTVERRQSTPATRTPPKGDVCMSAEELEVVMRSMGLMSDQEGQGDLAGEGESMIDTFEVQEPSMEEVQEAFVVFDRNGDGYVEADELGVVLRMLGLSEEASSPDKCERMIDAFDENGDGRIDFQEFVKLMERCLS